MSQIKVSGRDITKGTLKAINVVANATPFGSLISGITELISEITQIYEAAQCNKKICNALLDRAKSAELALESLNRRRQGSEENFRKKEYYHAFLRFEMVLQQIKDFAIDVSQLQGFEKIFKANLVSEKFTQLTNDFDEVMKDLNFTMAISSDEQRINDQKNLKEDLDEMKKFFLEFEERNNKKIDILIEKVSIMNKQILNKANDSTSMINEIRTRQIAQSELKDPFPGQKDDVRGAIFKKVFEECSDVACKPVNLPKEEPKLTNFEYARPITEETSQISNLSKLLNWLAPEKMKGHANYVKAGYSYGLLPNKTIDLNGMDNVYIETTMPDIEFKELEFDNNTFETILPLKEGINLHNKGDDESMQKAWRCFVANADIGNPMAKFWKGYYLSKGYVTDKNLEEAKVLFKKAADYGLPDAQLHYAFTLIEDMKDQEKQKEYLKYLKLSADQGNKEAEYHLGKLYLKGSIVEADREIGLNYLRLAALNDHVKAREFIKKENIDI
ncbi:22569_t:CDS:2 [Cetraspora pellucida]|uniref:22569_t:CDS:1 n=1 Tax=Cetraspora pellucida TaxID=1433469 RepID=A0A9N8VTB8_9GLOM|nr:22569_t:CDS:2 [Cetraspora pellucida]